MTDPGELLSAAEKIGSLFEGLLAKARVNDSGDARVAACLCLTIAELHVGVLALLRSRAQSHGPVLIRSMHEALADLKNIVGNPAHTDQMHFDNAAQAIKTFSGFRDDPDMKDEKDAQKVMADWLAKEQKTHDELKEKGYKSLFVSDKFRNAGMAGEYATAYRFLCSFSHNDLNTLIARHAGKGHLRFTDPLPPATLKSVLGMAVSLYARAIETLPRYTDLVAEKVKVITDEADGVWSAAVER